MSESEKILDELTPAERWIFENTEKIADIVSLSKDGRGVISRDHYEESMEEEIIQLLGYVSGIAIVEKADDGILVVAEPDSDYRKLMWR